MFEERQSYSPATSDTACVYGISSGRRSGLIHLTMSIASHKLNLLERNHQKITPHDLDEDTLEMGEDIKRLSSSLQILIDSEIRQQEDTKRLRNAGQNDFPFQSQGEPWRDAPYGATTESDLAVTEKSDGPITGDDFAKADGLAGKNRCAKGLGNQSLTSLLPFMLSIAFECPFVDLREIFQKALVRIRDELGLRLPDLGPNLHSHHWLRNLEASGSEPAGLNDLLTKARFFVRHGELPAHVRVVYGHWNVLADAHIATVHKLLFSDEGPLARHDRLVCALIASAAHNAEGLTRYLCSILLRNGQLHRPACEEELKRAQPAGDHAAPEGAARSLLESLLFAESWSQKYSTPRRICTILARKPWSLRRSDLDPILDHWSEPELIHMLTIFSYFLGIASLLAMLKIPCDPSTSYEVTEAIGERLGLSNKSNGNPQGTANERNEDSGHCSSWSLFKPLLSQLINGNENNDVRYQKRITKGGADCTLTTSMFSFDEGARSILDIFFPTLADDLSNEFSALESILNGNGFEEEVGGKVRVFDALKLAPKPCAPPPTVGVNGGNACTFKAQTPSQPEMRVLDVPDSKFWEACRYYSLNVAGVVDLSYNYCDINLNVGKFAKAFALSATMQPESDPSDASYGDPAIRPQTYEEEECILALGLCAMYAKIEALLLRSLSIIR